MKLNRIFITGLLSVCLSAASFAESIQHYKVTFENNNVYDITITPNQLTWKGLSGEEKGQMQTIKNYQHVNLSDTIEVFQWKGKTGNYITTVIDQNALKTVCSGQSKKERWLWTGTLERLPT